MSGADEAVPKPEVAPPPDAEIAAPKPLAPEIRLSPAWKAATLLLGAAAMAIVDIGVFLTRPYLKAPFAVRANAALVSTGYLFAIGAVLAALMYAWHTFGPRVRGASWVALGAVSWAIGYVFYGEDISGVADSLARKIAYHPLRMGLLTFALSLSVPFAIVIGRRLVRTWHWTAGLAAGAAGVILNGIEHDYPQIHLFITASYPGVHLLVAVLAVILAALSIERAPAPVLARVTALPARTQAALAGVASLFGALAIVLLPSNAVLLDLQRYPGAVLFPFLGKLHADVRGTPNVPSAKAEWFADRTSIPPIPPSLPKLVPTPEVVILLGIDSMRADLLSDEKYREDLPELFALRDQSVYFRNARAAGTSTAPSISAMFADLYYSQLYWTRTDLVDNSLVFPHEDKSPRFPELLTVAGVDTVTSEGTTWLISNLGVVRGFTEETSQRSGDYARADQILPPVLTALRHRRKAPQFYFVHMLDAHSPYTSAGKRTSPFLGYVAELSRIDKQIKRVLKAVDDPWHQRHTTLIIMADHGEAFGEHGTQRHAVSLYDELLRVPLIVYRPGVRPRVVDDDVSLMDIAPTILDLMGVETPGRYMGQSLTPYLRGEFPRLERPIVAEARLKRTMVMPDGFKVIYDTQTHVVEIYDLKSDPKEENNLYREGDPKSAERLGVLTAFFDAHTLRRPGYKVPYRKW